jgi:hypothetical protein
MLLLRTLQITYIRTILSPETEVRHRLEERESFPNEQRSAQRRLQVGGWQEFRKQISISTAPEFRKVLQPAVIVTCHNALDRKLELNTPYRSSVETFLCRTRILSYSAW